MDWSDFTKVNIKQFKKTKYKLDNKSNLTKLIRTERNRINSFINNNPMINIKTEEIKKNGIIELNKKMRELADTPWVDTESVVKQVDTLDKSYFYEWKSIVDNDDKPTTNYIYIKTNKININIMNKKIRLVVYIIEYLKHKNHHINIPISIYLVLTDLKKYFPVNNQNMGVKNANTGYTDFAKNIIYIWRKEELEKVIFHEISHYLDMDNRDHDVEHIAIINGPHSYFEAITDFWGILYHLIFVSILSKLSVKNLLSIELGFIKNQAMYLNEYLDLGNWKNSSNNVIKQTTPAFSYYIIKFMIFKYLLTHDLIDYHKYNDLISTISKIGFNQEPYIKIKSSRMTMIQLK